MSKRSGNGCPNANKLAQQHGRLVVNDQTALDALLTDAETREQKKLLQMSKAKCLSERNRWGDKAKFEKSKSPHSSPNKLHANNDPKTDYYQPQSKRHRKNEETDDSNYSWGGIINESDVHDSKERGESNEKIDEDATRKELPNFGLSGALAEDDKTGNMYNGILLKFSEPPEARTPNTRWRLYVFKKKWQEGTKKDDNSGELVETLHISKQSAYLFGREVKVADIAVHHPSLSKQHCVLQYRALPDKNDRDQRLLCKPYLMDLNSTNGTFINGIKIDDARYYELRKGDVITLGSSSREYVLLTENTTSADL